MPNPIKYSTGSETLALKKGNFYIGTGDVGKGPTNTTGYYNGITPPSGGYTIYLNKETGGPSIYTASNDAQLISLTNSIAGQSYTTANECLVYYASQTDKVCLNRDYEGIVTDGLVLNVDAGFTPSYPKSGTTWYDISKTNNGTLINGPTFNSDNGGSIVFDGSSDVVSINNSETFNFNDNITISVWFLISQYNNSYSGLFAKRTGGIAQFGINWSSNDNFINCYYSSSGWRGCTTNLLTNFPTNQWANITAVYVKDGGNTVTRMYKNGNQIATTTNIGNITSNSTPITIGSSGATNEPLNGKVSLAMIYNRALSASEVLQNYNAQKDRFGL